MMRALTIILSAALLAGCAHSGDTVFYTIDPVAPPSAAPTGAYAGPLQVDDVRLPAVLDRPELIRRTGPNTMAVDDFSRWAAPVGDLARRALTEDLVARLPAGSVLYPGAAAPPGAAGLNVDVLDFGVDNGVGHLDVSWSLASAGSNAPPAGRTLHLTVAESDTGSAGTADAMSRLMAALADAIAAQLAR
jgi:uncharacterized lipoprotein YmbA